MSKKRQTRNSKKFKKAAASQRARAPMQKEINETNGDYVTASE